MKNPLLYLAVSAFVGACASAFGQDSAQPRVVDPRMRCNECVRPSETRPWTKLDLPGFRGRPYEELPLGQCHCGNRTGVTRFPDASMYWPRPYSARIQNHAPELANWLTCHFAPAITKPFDGLGNFKGIPYQRRDNGYAGPGRDLYGCLGENNPSRDSFSRSW